MSFLGNKQREDELFFALAQEFKETAPAAEETVEAAPTDALASVIETLVKCAATLEELGHPGAAHVDQVLTFIEKDFLAAEAK